MRLDRAVLVTVCLALVGHGAVGCFNPPGAGTEGHPCRSGLVASLCDPGLRCVDGDCHACGGVGLMCCNNNAEGDFCLFTDLTCDDSASGVGECTGDCGFIGLPCCPDAACPGSGDCQESGMCEGESETCSNGDVDFIVYVVDSSCGSWKVELHTNTIEAAEACRQAIIDGGKDGDLDVGDLNGAPPSFTSVCQDGWGPLEFWHYTAEQLAACEANMCAIEACTWTPPDINGNCPEGPKI